MGVQRGAPAIEGPMKARLRSPTLIDAPLAIVSDGGLVVNATHMFEGEDEHEMLEAALAAGRKVFVGVLLHSDEVTAVVDELEDAVVDIIARVVTP